MHSLKRRVHGVYPLQPQSHFTCTCLHKPSLSDNHNANISQVDTTYRSVPLKVWHAYIFIFEAWKQCSGRRDGGEPCPRGSAAHARPYFGFTAPSHWEVIFYPLNLINPEAELRGAPPPRTNFPESYDTPPVLTSIYNITPARYAVHGALRSYLSSTNVKKRNFETVINVCIT